MDRTRENSRFVVSCNGQFIAAYPTRSLAQGKAQAEQAYRRGIGEQAVCLVQDINPGPQRPWLWDALGFEMKKRES